MPDPRRWKPALALAAILLVAIFIAWKLRDPGPIHDGPMVQLLDTDGFALTWRMPALAEAEVAEVVVRGEGPGDEMIFPAVPGDRFTARVTDLEPASFYDYRIRRRGGTGESVDRTVVLAQGRTRTAPERGGSFRFVVTGDSGSGSEEQYGLGRLMYEYDPDLVIHVGDIVHPDGTLRYYPAQFFRPYRDLLKRAAVYSCVGNHDWETNQGEAIFQVFELPDNGVEGRSDLACYWFDFGDVRFVALNSNVAFSEVERYQKPWLEDVLGGASDRWKVVFFHHPVYTARMHASRGAFRHLIVPVIDEHEVDLVLVGHNHKYERSYPLRDGQVVEPGEGTIHITAGSGGSSLRTFGSPQPDFIAARDDAQYSFTVIDVEPARMVVQQVGLDESVLDRFEIPRRSATTQPPDQFLEVAP